MLYRAKAVSASGTVSEVRRHWEGTARLRKKMQKKNLKIGGELAREAAAAAWGLTLHWSVGGEQLFASLVWYICNYHYCSLFLLPFLLCFLF